MTLGKLLYIVYYRPYAFFKKLKKYGFANSWHIERQRQKMEAYATVLKQVARPGRPEYVVYFLTGKKYWYQTAFCLHSLQKQAGSIQVNAIFIDDGTFDDVLMRQMTTQFPGSRAIPAEETEAVLVRVLPPDKFPLLHQKRRVYPHIRKLTDVHAGSTGWKMVLDSDMLFFNDPLEMSDWLKNPLKPFFLQDPEYSYFYSPGLMAQLAGSGITPQLNVGVIGLKSEQLDWEKIEKWIGQLEASEGGHYFLEQAISAMLVAGRPITIADSAAYLVMPGKQEALNPAATLHHYVAGSKEWYYKKSWQLTI